MSTHLRPAGGQRDHTGQGLFSRGTGRLLPEECTTQEGSLDAFTFGFTESTWAFGTPTVSLGGREGSAGLGPRLLQVLQPLLGREAWT